MELPPYSGTRPTCPKCGQLGASVKYRSWTRCLGPEHQERLGKELNERLHRECENCGYMWDEACTGS